MNMKITLPAHYTETKRVEAEIDITELYHKLRNEILKKEKIQIDAFLKYDSKN